MIQKNGYLDWNSYGLIAPEVMKKMTETWYEYGNTNAKHSLGQRSKGYLLELTANLFRIIKATKEYRCIFLPSATQANLFTLRNYKKIYVSDVEHPSVRNCPYAKILPVDGNGQVDKNFLEEILKKTEPPFLVSFMLANHETGLVNDVISVGNLVHKYGGHFHVDAVQAYGRLDINLGEINADYLTICGHKCGGPIGIAALFHRNMFGCLTWDMRQGTIPLPLIAGFVESAKVERGDNREFEKMLNGVEIIGQNLNRLPNTTCIICPNKTEVLMALDMHGIMVSSGAACVEGSSDRAHSVFAMGLDFETIRISSGWSTMLEDYSKCAEVLNKFMKNN